MRIFEQCVLLPDETFEESDEKLLLNEEKREDILRLKIGVPFPAIFEN